HEAGADRGRPDIQAIEGAQRSRGKIGSKHEEGAMCQVGEPHQAKDQRKTRRQQEQEAAERQAIETLDDPKLHGRPILFFWLVRSRARARPCSSGGNSTRIEASTCGAIAVAVRPWRIRPATSMAGDHATPHSTEAMVNPATPTRNIRRRP